MPRRNRGRTDPVSLVGVLDQVCRLCSGDDIPSQPGKSVLLFHNNPRGGTPNRFLLDGTSAQACLNLARRLQLRRAQYCGVALHLNAISLQPFDGTPAELVERPWLVGIIGHSGELQFRVGPLPAETGHDSPSWLRVAEFFVPDALKINLGALRQLMCQTGQGQYLRFDLSTLRVNPLVLEVPAFRSALVVAV